MQAEWTDNLIAALATGQEEMKKTIALRRSVNFARRSRL